MAQDKDPNDEKGNDPDIERKRKQARDRLRTIVLGALATTGGIGVVAWQAQAHGNRSSHMTSDLRWPVDKYIFERERTLDPNSPSVMQLGQIVGEIDQLDARRRAFATTGDTADKPSLSDNVRLQTLTGQRNLIESSMAYRPLTLQVISMLKNGNTESAVKTIESAANPADVLQGYIFTQLDLYNASFVDGKSTGAFTEEIMTISEAGIRYAATLPQTDATKRGTAALLHNLATAMTPDVGKVSADNFAKGRSAAERAVQIRAELGEQGPIAQAKWMKALYDYKSGNYIVAAAEFNEADQLLDAIIKSRAANVQTSLKADQAEAQIYRSLSNIEAGKSKSSQTKSITEGLNTLAALPAVYKNPSITDEIARVTNPNRRKK